MIGQIEFLSEGRPLVAVLGDDGVWSCADSAEVAERLNRDFSPVGVLVGSGNWGHWELIAAAHSFRGRAFLGERRPPNGGSGDAPTAA